MDLRQPPPPPPPQHQTHPQPPPGMMVGLPSNSYNAPNFSINNNNSTNSNTSSPMLQNPRFPFTNSGLMPGSKPMESVNFPYGDGSHMVSPPSAFSIETSGKKKRGRPRKYSPDSNIALGLAPTPSPVTPLSASSPLAPVVGHGDSGGGGAVSSDPSQAKRSRGRPPGSGKKQLDALGSYGVSFTPHVILVKAGEDIAAKIMDFSQQGPRTVCILSANGAVCNVTLRQPAMSGGTVTYEGRFEIISLSGSFFLSESNGSRSRTGGLSVSLAGSDRRVLGGGVAGVLVAATPVQVIVGSFIADGKKLKSGPPSAPMSNMLNFSEPVAAVSPPSQDHSGESSDENGGSPFNGGHGASEPYNNASQPIHSTMPMYSNMGWGNNM